jgi:hypothetical protein
LLCLDSNRRVARTRFASEDFVFSKHQEGTSFEGGADRQWRKTMKSMSLRTVAIAATTFAGAALLSFGWSEQGGVSLSVDSAQARVGRPATPMSGAGVARRHYRRAGGYGYGAGAAVAGAAAIGTAAAVAATSPNWGYNPYYGGRPYYGGAFAGTSDARAAYGGGPAFGGGGPAWGGPWGGVSNSDRELYFKNLHDSGYDPKNNFTANGTIKG